MSPPDTSSEEAPHATTDGIVAGLTTVVAAAPAAHDVTAPIRLRGVRQNNLKSIDVEFPYDKFTVVTGVSGSGKSSLVFDTLYAEGQRRYVESFSAYARQFLERMPRPAADSIEDLPPAVAVEQANPVRTSRSTVGTMTELTDHLKLLFAKAATLFCSKCGQPVEIERAETVADAIESLPAGTKVLLTFPWPIAGSLPFEEQVAGLRAAGYVRGVFEDQVQNLGDIGAKTGDRAQLSSSPSPGAEAPPPSDAEPPAKPKPSKRAPAKRAAAAKSTASKKAAAAPPPPPTAVAAPAAAAPEVLCDRFVVGRTERTRLLGSAEQALRHGRGRAAIRILSDDPAATVPSVVVRRFSSELHCAGCDIAFRPSTANLFSFNSPIGACPSCRGFGRTIEPNLSAIVPDPHRSLSGGAIKPWTTPRTRPERRELELFCKRRGIDTFRPWDLLPPKHRKEILEGTKDFFGIAGWMKWLEGKSYKMHVRVLLARYRAYVECAECKGTRRRAESLAWRVAGLNVYQWELLPIADALRTLRGLVLSPQAEELSRIIREGIDSRLAYLDDVGLGYLTLDRATKTLSGGEFQRVNLATALGAALVNTLYVLDEPSIGLHPRDTGRLLGILSKLRDRGNTLVVVEHDPETILAADHVVDLGPGAGTRGGEVLFQGPLSALRDSPTSLTARFLRGEESVRPRADGLVRRVPRGWLSLKGCRGHNLQGVELRIPEGTLTAICGVSGSGKSSLLLGTLLPVMLRRLGRTSEEPLPHDALEGAEHFNDVVLVDQSPIGRTPRSNPVTYTGAMTHLRNLLGKTDSAKRLGLSPKAFSFNSRGGRCSACDGAGAELLEMQFLADVYVPCSECDGKRFKPDVLEVRFRGRNVHEILQMTVEQALQFFGGGQPAEWRLREALTPLEQVGLGYLQLGQSAVTLSGGEAQRLKLASHLPKGPQGRARRGKPTLFLFDEPTTGLHLSDVRTLLG
ncbi:MAG: excinuclease ABC subunit UvrA [Planctomycetes bacterium]|nr:excinuclease ABC subunit UvrA [Planctomycetota bacterium]